MSDLYILLNVNFICWNGHLAVVILTKKKDNMWGFKSQVPGLKLGVFVKPSQAPNIAGHRPPDLPKSAPNTAGHRPPDPPKPPTKSPLEGEEAKRNATPSALRIQRPPWAQAEWSVVEGKAL